MFKRELNEHIISGLKIFFESKEYKLKKTNEVIYFKKRLKNGFEDIGISSDNYYDTHYIRFGYGKRIDEIENIVFELEKYFEPNIFLITKKNSTYYLNVVYDVTLPDWIKKDIKNEQDVKRITDWIIQYTIDYAFEKFNYLNDLEAVDNEINGEIFWLDDKDKPYGLHRFDVYRIVIAKLAKSSEEYKKFTDKLMAIEEKRIEEIRLSDEKYKDLKNWFVPKILTHLEEIVK